MKNQYIKYILVFLAVLLVSCVSFLIPIEKTASFWVSYVFYWMHSILLAFILHLAFDKTDSLKDKFFHLPITRQGIIFYILQLILLAVTLFVSVIPVWLSAILNIVLFGVAIAKLLVLHMAKDTIVHTENVVKEKTFFLKSLQVDLEMMAEKEENNDIKAKLTALAEKFQYSDPMSNDALKDIETEITNKVQELKQAENKVELIGEIEMLLMERNKKCKILK